MESMNGLIKNINLIRTVVVGVLVTILLIDAAAWLILFLMGKVKSYF